MLWFQITAFLAALCWQQSKAGSCDRMQALGDKLTKLFKQMSPPLLKLAEQLSDVDELLGNKCSKALDDYKTCNKFLEEANSLESSLEKKCSRLRGLRGSGGRKGDDSDYGDDSGQGNGRGGGNGNGSGNGRGNGRNNGNRGGGQQGGDGNNGGGSWNNGNGNGNWNNGNGGGNRNGGNGAGGWDRGSGNGGYNGQSMSGAQSGAAFQGSATGGGGSAQSQIGLSNSPCPNQWFNNGSYCYRLMTVPNAWQDADRVCTGMGGHLASIHSAAENAFIMGLAGIGTFHGTPANTLLPNAWIGLRSYGSGAWQWIDGTPIDYQYWGPAYPSWGFEQCGQLIYRSLNNGKFGSSILSTWNNYACSMAVHNFICKMKVNRS